MESYIQPLNRYYLDHHGIVVHVTGYDADRQRVIYRRTGYEWDCASPLLVFRTNFTRIDPPIERDMVSDFIYAAVEAFKKVVCK